MSWKGGRDGSFCLGLTVVSGRQTVRAIAGKEKTPREKNKLMLHRAAATEDRKIDLKVSERECIAISRCSWPHKCLSARSVKISSRSGLHLLSDFFSRKCEDNVITLPNHLKDFVKRTY